jgi:large subunit ribosomal protein L2
MKSFILYKNSYSLPKNLSSFSKNFNLYESKVRKSGRNNEGRICVFHRGGGHKKNYRPLNKKNTYFKNRLVSIEYDPNRSSFIGLYFDSLKDKMYFDSVCEGQVVGSFYKFGKSAEDALIGNKMYLKDIPLGMLINSLEYKIGKGSQYLRSAGAFGKLQQKNFQLNLARIKMPSKKEIYVPLDCIATIGIVSNSFHKNKNIAKAGRNRWLNKRPIVRGVAMNPVDHPHGGGEGKTSGGRHPVSP